MAIKNRTYHNLMIVINKLEREKGYPLAEAKKIADGIFDNFNPNGLSIEEMVRRVLPYSVDVEA